MGLFDGLFGKKEPKTYEDSDVVAVVSGKVIRNQDIPDPVFAQEMLGKTFAVKPSGVKAVAPANGTLEVLFPTGHAFAVRTADGTGLLVHVGIDTVNLKGKGFKVIVTVAVPPEVELKEYKGLKAERELRNKCHHMQPTSISQRVQENSTGKE